MRVVLLPADVVDADVVAELDADRVGDEAREDVAAEHIARQLVAEVLMRPQVMHVVRAVETIEEVRDPSGAAL